MWSLLLVDRHCCHRKSAACSVLPWCPLEQLQRELVEPHVFVRDLEAHCIRLRLMLVGAGTLPLLRASFCFRLK